MAPVFLISTIGPDLARLVLLALRMLHPLQHGHNKRRPRSQPHGAQAQPRNADGLSCHGLPGPQCFFPKRLLSGAVSEA